MRSESEDREVVFVDHTAELGGAELYLLDLVRNMKRPRRVVVFQQGPLVDELERSGIRVDIIESPAQIKSVRKDSGAFGALLSIPSLLPFIWRLRRAFRGAETVFLNSQKSLVAGAPAAWLARAPCVWSLHDILASDHFGSSSRRIAVSVARRFVDHVVVNSQATKEALYEAGYTKPNVDVVFNGIDPEPYDSVDRSAGLRARRDLGLPQDAVVVGLFGRLSEWKGQLVLVHALSQIDNLHALIVGAALFPDDEIYEASVREAVANLGLSSRITFTGFRSDVPVLMKACDVVAHTSVAAEPFGRVIVEAMISGIPVIATRDGGAMEVITDGVTGLLVTPGDASDLASAITAIVTSPGSAQERARRARRDAINRFSIESMVRGIEEVFGPIRAR